MNVKDCIFHFKIHRFAESLTKKRNIWLAGIGGMLINFNMALVYAKVLATGAAQSTKGKK